MNIKLACVLLVPQEISLLIKEDVKDVQRILSLLLQLANVLLVE